MTHMKTTLDLPDELLIEAKTAAAQRRTTLKAIVVKALTRELAPPPEPLSNPDPDKFETGPLGFLVLKRKPGEVVTREQIRAIREDLDDEAFHRTLHPRQK